MDASDDRSLNPPIWNLIKRNKVIVIPLLFLVCIVLVIAIPLSLQEPPEPSVVVEHYTGLKVIPEGDICFNSNDPLSYISYINQLEEFIEPYKNSRSRKNVILCHKHDRNDSENCHIDDTWIYPCGNRDWGYSWGNPCVILSYSNDSSFLPIPYEKMDELPSDVPAEVKEIAMEEIEYDGFDNMLVRLHCTHVDMYDYHPKGFYNFFFPNLEEVDGYLPPIASVSFKFTNEEEMPIPGEYDVKCSLWSKEPNVKEVKKVSFKIKQDNC